MHTPQESQGKRDIIQQAQQVAHAAMHSQDTHEHAFTVSICDVNLPCYLADGILYVQAPLVSIFDAFASEMADNLRDLEARISETRRTALAFASAKCTVCAERMASEGVV